MVTPLEIAMWYVYVLQSNKIHWYIGSTKDLRKRILKHNSGENKSTKYGIPWKVIYYEAALNRKDARAKEKYIK